MDAVAVRIEGRGTPESAWQGCAWLSALPLVEAAAVLRDTRCLVVVSPHPDDEVLGCGGLMLLQGWSADPISVARREGLR